MPETVRARFALVVLALLAAVFPACGGREIALHPRSQTWAELRVVRRAVTVAPPGEPDRAPYPRERLVDGEAIHVAANGLAWLRRDGGATLLIRGPARLVLRADTLELTEGRVFIDTPASDATTALVTPGGPLHLAQVRASIDAGADGTTEAYVLSGEVRTDGAVRAVAGERIRVKAAAATVSPVISWEDWTGGLATTDRAAEPAPYGVGTVGARLPGQQGSPRFPLSIQRLDVNVTIDHDFAVTEVDEIFFNPSSDVVEGVYRFRTPDGATLHRFGVDRDGVIVWGRPKEKQAAAAQYQANVYQGSTEDPALLEWDAPGVYRARLYPIGPGESRRVVVRYASFLGRTGKKGERRLYVYPMAAEGPEGTLPVIEELSVRVDLSKAAAKEVRVGMEGVLENNRVSVLEHDLVPRADLAIELFDDGGSPVTGYRAPHAAALDLTPLAERAEAARRAREEADYVLVRLTPGGISGTMDPDGPEGGLDLGIIVDTSAATDPAALALARAATAAILTHLGPEDRAAVWAGDTGLRPVARDKPGLSPVDEASRRRILSGLATLERGGATDLGGMLSEAASALDPARRGAIVYIGDGAPTVGEASLTELRARLDKLPRPVRIFGLGVGDGADLAVLKGLSAGAFADRIGDGNAAARAALRVLEQAERPALLGASIDLGSLVERIFPRNLGVITADESLFVVGRATSPLSPISVTLAGPSGKTTSPLLVSTIDDRGDLSQRWGEARLAQLLDEGAGKAALVDLGMRHHVVTPYTSFYVPTKNEMTPEERVELAREKLQILATTPAREHKPRIASKNLGDHEGDDEERTVALDDVSKSQQDLVDLTRKLEAAKEEANGEKAAQGQGWMRSKSEAAATAVAAAPTPEVAARAPVAVGGAAKQQAGKCAPGDPLCGGDLPAAPPAVFEPTPMQDQAPLAQGAKPAPTATAPAAPTAPWGRDDSLGSDPLSARGNMWGSDIGDSFGAGGLGLTGMGEGGGGRGEGIGLGSIGTIGHGEGTGTGQGFGSGHGRLGGAHRSAPPRVKLGAVQVAGQLPPEVVTRIVRQSFGRFRLCYENGLRNNPNLQGRVATRFVINREGEVTALSNGGSDMPDAGVVQCVVRGYASMSFPEPASGTVTVTVPIMFTPGGGSITADDEPKAAPAIGTGNANAKGNAGDAIGKGNASAKGNANAKVTSAVEEDRPATSVQVDVVPHEARRCGDGAFVSFEDRVILWRERISRFPTSPESVAMIYQKALARCEAPTWRERARLLSLMLDGLARVTDKVSLWRAMFSDKIAADTLYRGILARVKTSKELAELHAALGLKAMDAAELAKLIKGSKSPVDRVAKLRAAQKAWPDDFTLAMRLLDALEDAGDSDGARALGRALRARPDADATLRTAVGELTLRLAAGRSDPAGKAEDEAEARRAFGEIVEFAPDDPVARRRLGDLLRAHGWFEDAARQYETLARLAPDDASVALLLAAAAQGLGRLEAAVKWTEKAGAASAPTDTAAINARAFAATYLAWGRLDAIAASHPDDAKAIAVRLRRVVGGEQGRAPRGIRAVLTWAHPELHPTLWSDALGALLPAPEGDAALGVAQVMLPDRTGDRRLSVRLEADEVDHAARLGAAATLTVIFDEGSGEDTVVKIPITFTRGGPKDRRFVVRGREVREAP